MKLAMEKGLPVPAPLVNKKGASLSCFEYRNVTKAFILCEKLPGAHPEIITPALCFELGKIFANIHKLSENTSPGRLIPFQGLDFILPENLPDFTDAEKKQRFKKESAAVSALSEQCRGLPSGPCHCDFFPDNALVNYSGEKPSISGLLDWYDLRNSYFLLDLAVIVVSWCKNDSGLVEDRVEALLEGYQTIRELTQQESDLWPRFIRAAALMFWLSREVYVKKMEEQGREALGHKKPEEFFALLRLLD